MCVIAYVQAKVLEAKVSREFAKPKDGMEHNIPYYEVDRLHPVSYTHLDVYKRQV